MKRLILILLALYTTSLYIQAQVTAKNDSVQSSVSVKKKRGKEPKQAETVNTKKAEWYPTTVYLYAISSEFGDTAVYITDIIELDSVQLTKRYDYLTFRSDYSSQLKQYLADKYGKNLQTVAVFFDKDKKKIDKRYNKILKRYKATKGYELITVSKEEFTFKLPDYAIYQNVII